ncbi:feruloyl-CoA synthetase [Bacillus sp. OxB-1]|uniref:o-succinylbenzoate--CoA ligase n=1 Tax=Bacillus sp. (strain OxB-1) TaxID=98228 RepID=UPI0005822221|nr:o-succinylbenzoate--CoA ligase [Bacillus sp. OxB-1]BAQ11084.1 feruloyl-CoA synthetase [Bacillus sp. OxB-1]
MQGISYWIEKRAYITPERIALVGNGRKYTYKEMADSIEQTVYVLGNELQIKKGQRIAILSSNNTAYMVMYFALAKMGCIIVPLNTRLSIKELEYQLNDCQATYLFTSDMFMQIGKDLQQLCGVKCLLLDSISKYPLDSMASAKKQQFSYTDVTAASPFIICYTSGTTGRPKGAVLTQENVYWNAVNNLLALDITSSDRMLTLLPFFHIGGIGLFTFPVFFAGGTVVIPDSTEPQHVLHTIEKEHITLVMGVPTIFSSLKNSDAFETTNFDSIRWLYSGGGPCPPDLIRHYLEKGIPLGQGYGLTEASPTVFMLSKEDYMKRVGSIGKPAMFCDVRIVNSEGEDAVPNEVGELLVKGPNVINGYWNLPEETEKAFIDGWFCTGDLVRADEEGFVYIAGRKKDMLISGGENIYPIEVEQVILQHPAVEEVAVFGVSDPKWGEVPVASVILTEGAHVTESEIISHCLKRLTKYKCPKKVEFVKDFPRSSIGKVNKVLLKNEFPGKEFAK